MSNRIDYGLDAPGLFRAFVGVAASAFLIATGSIAARWPTALTILACSVGLYASVMILLMFYGSRIWKVRERDRLLDRLQWQGDERVLDLGCGRGLMLLGAARRLTSSLAIGIDLWVAKDQANNGPQATAKNAEALGVANRVRIETGDIRKLTFPENSFYVVLSHWVIHNLESPEDRRRSLAEANRVLAEGGALVLADIANREEYRRELCALGLSLVTESVGRSYATVSKALSFGNFWPTAQIWRKERSAPSPEV